MGLHVVAVAKLHWKLTSHGLRPAVGGVAWPLVLKLMMGFRLFRDEALHQSRWFLFRLAHIAFNRDTPISNLARMERALRLIWGTTLSSTIASATPSSQESEIGHRTFHDLSVIAL